MKKSLFLLLLLCSVLTAFSQTTTTTPPTAHIDTPWHIHGQNTLLLSQSSFSNWSAGGTDAVAVNAVLVG